MRSTAAHAGNGSGLPRPFPDLGDVLEFIRLVWAVDHALQGISKRMLSTIGVTGPQRLVIRIVARFPGIPAGRLAELLHLHPSTLSGIVKRLERRGFMRRRPDPRDRRRALLAITSKGRGIDLSSVRTVEAAVERAIGGMSRPALQQAKKVLIGLADSLEREREGEGASVKGSARGGPDGRTRSRLPAARAL